MMLLGEDEGLEYYMKHDEEKSRYRYLIFM
jgi:hypothetical protein